MHIQPCFPASHQQLPRFLRFIAVGPSSAARVGNLFDQLQFSDVVSSPCSHLSTPSFTESLLSAILVSSLIPVTVLLLSSAT
ncbi:hypothetical protein AAC387_Pa02g0012 [Persea americana]